MKTKTVIISLMLLVGISSPAADFSQFLKACGYGALVGAGVGVVSLALENKPSDHYANVTRGASLGLYGGIAYGAYLLNPPREHKMHNDIEMGTQTVIVPKFTQAKVDGLEINSTVYNF
jgi:hypothetical protein